MSETRNSGLFRYRCVWVNCLCVWVNYLCVRENSSSTEKSNPCRNHSWPRIWFISVTQDCSSVRVSENWQRCRLSIFCSYFWHIQIQKHIYPNNNMMVRQCLLAVENLQQLLLWITSIGNSSIGTEDKSCLYATVIAIEMIWENLGPFPESKERKIDFLYHLSQTNSRYQVEEHCSCKVHRKI